MGAGWVGDNRGKVGRGRRRKDEKNMVCIWKLKVCGGVHRNGMVLSW